jgi:hypothetical protein
MKRRNIRIEFVGMIILMTILACVLPGQAAQPQPEVANDPNALSTFIAGTAQVLAEQTAQAASPTSPVLTDTPVPSTATTIPTPKLSVQNTLLAIQPDGSALFSDYSARVEFALPSLWMPVRAGEPEYYRAWESDFASENQYVQDSLSKLQTLDPAVSRLIAFDVRPGYIFNGSFTVMGAVYETKFTRTLEEWLEVESKGDTYEDQKVTASRRYQNKNGVDLIELEETYKGLHDGYIYHKSLFFTVPGGTFFLDFYCDLEHKDILNADFDAVINSIKLISQ